MNSIKDRLSFLIESIERHQSEDLQAMLEELGPAIRAIQPICFKLLGKYICARLTHSHFLVLITSTGFTGSGLLASHQREDLVILFSAFTRDLIEMIFAVGQAINDIRILAKDDRIAQASDNISTSLDVQSGEPSLDLRFELCNMVVLVCRQLPALAPPTAMMFAEKCTQMSYIMRQAESTFPTLFDDLKLRDTYEDIVPKTQLPFSTLTKQDEQYAAASALDTSYYFLYGLSELLNLWHSDASDGGVSTNFITGTLDMAAHVDDYWMNAIWNP